MSPHRPTLHASAWARERENTIALLLALGLALLPHLWVMPAWIGVGVGSLLVWRLVNLWRRKGPAPRWALMVFLAAALAAVAWQFGTIVGQEAGTALLVILMGLKLMEMRAQRDARVLIFMSFFVLLTQFMLDQSLRTAIWLLVAVWALFTLMVSLQYGEQAPRWRARILTAGRLMLIALPVVVLLFVLFPRISNPLWGQGQSQGASTGLSDSMSPGDISSLSTSTALAFRAEFEGDVPTPAQRYWRALVLSDFDGRNWTTRPSVSQNLAPQPSAAGSSAYTVTLEGQGQVWIPVLEHVPGSVSLAGNATRLTRDGTVQAARPLYNRTQYRVEGWTTGLSLPAVDGLSLEPFLRLPPGFNPRTLQLGLELQAEELRASDMGPGIEARIAQRALRRFREQAYRYTLSPPTLGVHTADEFLFDTLAGFCEHYASAFVILMRAADVPARVVTGYQGGEWNPLSGLITVRQADAHAWAEIFVRGQGWQRVDPTAWVAPERIEQGQLLTPLTGVEVPMVGRLFADVSWLATLRLRMDAIDASWNLWVLQWNSERQLDLLNRLGLLERGVTALGPALAILIALLALVSGLWAMRRPRASAMDPEQQSWQRIVHELQARGLSDLGLHLGPATVRQRVVPQLSPEAGALLEQLTRHYEALRYQPNCDEHTQQAFLRACRHFLKALSHESVPYTPASSQST